ncbi:hypothetical protein N7481_006156 [Penicillium waksmanii]|uniref:uncharacterized protein n=1 Tax=Penicillium waksmanii TaxID=69791 RepID=UPI002548A594|nr:uncharacterized protein N7481_006156 [Penicillium waksmanii]KAJ5984057.1 hypothetical protein N7481_006156 [Penicillium waksmanii]
MRTAIISFLIAFTATAAGLVITSPTVEQNVDNSKSVTVKWHAVETDPDTFSIYLVNQNVYPPTQELVASDVPKNKGSYTINAKSIDGVDTGRGYQVNFVSDTDTQAILAQSSQFKCVNLFFIFFIFELYHSNTYHIPLFNVVYNDIYTLFLFFFLNIKHPIYYSLLNFVRDSFIFYIAQFH